MPRTKVGVAVNDVILVRLARLPGMPEEDPSPEDVLEMRQAMGDPGTLEKLLKARRKETDNEDYSADQLNEMLFLYPRVREATVSYVDRTSTGAARPYGLSRPVSSVNSLNLDVFTLGSTVLQPAVGKIPKWAQQSFRLEGVQWFDEEPEDNHEIHVAYPKPQPE